MKQTLRASLMILVVMGLVGCSNPSGYTPPPAPPAPDNDIASWFGGIYLDLLDRERNGTMGAVANCQYVCNAINAKWNKSIAPVPGTELQPANCKYLLSMIDQYVNDGISSYGTSSFATEQIIDTAACDQTIGRLAAPFLAWLSNYTGSSTNYYLAYSPDGASWQLVDSNNRPWILGAYGNGRYVLICLNTTNSVMVKSSADCITWTSPITISNLNFNSTTFNFITFGNGVFVLAGYVPGAYRVVSLVSADGINWSSPSNLSPLPVNDIIGINYGNGKFVVVMRTSSNGTSVFHSTDGQNWNEAVPPNNERLPYYFDFLGGRFIYNYASSIVSSTDGINWTNSQVLSPNTRYPFRNVLYGNGVYLVDGVDSVLNGQQQHMFRSTDAVNWVDLGVSSISITDKTQYGYGNGIFINFAGLSTSIVKRSSDNGQTWSLIPKSSSVPFRLNKGMFSKGRFVGFDARGPGNSNPITNKAAWSIDGINWNATTMPVATGAPGWDSSSWRPTVIKGL